MFDDPDNLSAQYQPGERKHGTAMASLVVHGEMVDGHSDPLQRLVYVLPIMQPDPHSMSRSEHVPDEVFFEDRIARAVRRMFEGEGGIGKGKKLEVVSALRQAILYEVHRQIFANFTTKEESLAADNAWYRLLTALDRSPFLG